MRPGPLAAPAFLALIRAGERTSDLPGALADLAMLSSRLEEARRRFASAIAYPTFAVVLSSVLAILSGALISARLDPDVKESSEDAPAVTPGAEPKTGAATSVWTILWQIKTSCFGTFAYGYFQASVVLFLPLYLRDAKHITEGQTLIEDVLPGESCERVLGYMNYDKGQMLASIAEQLRRVAGKPLKKQEIEAISREFVDVFPNYTYLER